MRNDKKVDFKARIAEDTTSQKYTGESIYSSVFGCSAAS